MSAEVVAFPVVRVEREPSSNGAREALVEALEIYRVDCPEGVADALLALLWGAGFKIVPIDEALK